MRKRIGKKYGYGRVSSPGQERNGNSLEDQCSKLYDAGADEVVTEVYTGTTMDRPGLNSVVEKLEPGDTLLVCKLDRLARTAGEGSTFIKKLIARGIKVHILNMGVIEETSNGRLILNILLSFAEFERDMIVERLNDGKVIAKANNPDYKEGRKKFDIPEEFSEYRDMVDEGTITVVGACEKLGISRSLWYKWLKEVA